jgi:hypothetical protein
MKLSPLAALTAVGASALLSAQSPLDVFPTGAAYYGWNTPPPIHTNLFDLTVTNQVTLQAISTPLLTPVGVTGNIEVWLTNPGTTTYVGNHLNQAVWSMVATGSITGNGTVGSVVALTATTCQQAVGGGGLVLNPGSYGVILRYTNGVTPLLAALPTVQTIGNADLSVSGGAVQYTPWTALNAPPATFAAWGWRGSIIYQPGTFPHACAENSRYGAGCYTVGGSAYQEWTDNAVPSAAAAASAALTGRSISFIPSGSGYLMLPGTAAWIAPTGAATALPAIDDNENQINLLLPFNYPGGSTQTLFVHSNGYVSVASNQTLPGGFNDIPEIAPMLNAPATAWWSWHDYNPTEAGSGQIVYEEVGTTMVITWNGVESYPTTAVNPSTFQFQFDEITGQVNILWQTIEAVGGTGFLQGSDHIIGFSPGGESPDTGPFDVTTLTTVTLNYPEAFPLALAAASKPLIGTTVSLDTSRETGQSLGINFVSLVQIPTPGFNLNVIGAPDCFAHLDINAGVGNVISNLGLPGTSMSVQFPLPNNPVFAGLSIYSQSIWLDPAVNAFGALTSNGVKMLLGNF